MWSYLKDHLFGVFVLLPSTVAVATLLWRAIKRYPSVIIMKPTEENQFICNQCPSLTEYRPTPWIFNGHLMTILGALLRPLLPMSFERIPLTVDSTGGTIAMDWHTRPYRGQPILLILHGLTGGSNHPYIRWLVSAVSSRLDLCCVVAHARGCGRSKLTSPMSFSAANTDDVRAALKYLRLLVGDETPIFAIGYSLGAGILTKFLGEEGSQCSLQGAFVCCASFDMHLTTKNLERWLHLRLYNRQLTKNLLKYLRQHEEHFTKSNSTLNFNNIYQSRTVRDYDRHVVVPMHGFRDVEHYYTEASSNKWLKHIRIPTLVLNAMDDPICPVSGLPNDDASNNPYIITVKTLEGGHVSHLQGWWPKSFSYDNQVAVEYFRARLKQMNYQWEKKFDEQSIVNISVPKGF